MITNEFAKVKKCQYIIDIVQCKKRLLTWLGHELVTILL